LRTAAAGKQTQLNLGLPELCVLHRDPDGAGHRGFASGAEREAIDGSNDGLAEIFDEFQHGLSESAGFLGLESAGLRQFGLAFGTGYQVYDDCVDLFGSEAVAGKSLGTDLAKGKLTLPVLLLRERADAADRVRLQGLVGAWHAGSMKGMAELLAKYATLNSSLEIVHEYLEKARHILQALPPSNGRKGLLGLTQHLAGQADALEACV